MFQPKAHSIVGKFTGWYIFSAFILILLSTSYLYWSLLETLVKEDQAVLQRRIRTVRSLINEKTDVLESIKKKIELEWSIPDYIPVFIKVVGDKKKILLQSKGFPDDLNEEVYLSENIGKNPKEFRTSLGHSYMALVEEVSNVDDQIGIKKIFFALNLSHEQKILRSYQMKLVLILALSLLLCTLIGNQIAVSVFKPVKDLVEAAGKIRSTTLHERVSHEKLPLELKTLANTMNAMLDRLEGSFDRLSRFSSDISHELRTPINNLRGEIEVTLAKPRSVEEYQEVLQSSLEESIRISRIIDSLLFLAKAENPITQIQKEAVNLSNEVRKIVEFYEPTAIEEGIEIQNSIREHVSVQVERMLFQRAIGNIVANAINYTPKGGKISISDFEDGSQICIVVADTGQGIDEAHLPHVFDRFYRVDPSRTTTKLGGFGLGLTIVKSILKLHGGDIAIKSQLQLGTEVLLSFPKET